MIINDTQLVSRVLTDDDHYAFSQLVKKYQSPLRLFLRRMLDNDQSAADDIAQETFILAYKKIETFQGRSSFASWLYGIAKNQFLMHMRKRKKSFSWEEESTHNDMTALKMDLEEAMSFLRPIEKAVITMCYCEELSQTDVSDILDIPLGTVKTHLDRGKKKLRKNLQSYSEGDRS